jgi:hypothetical protein
MIRSASPHEDAEVVVEQVVHAHVRLQRRSLVLTRVMMPNCPKPQRTTSKSSRFWLREQVTISPSPVTTSSSTELSAWVP